MCNIQNTLVMSGGSRLEVSLRREIELWQRPPVTAIRVLKFCRARSFYRRKSRVNDCGVRHGTLSHFPKNKTQTSTVLGSRTKIPLSLLASFCDIWSPRQFTWATWMNLVKTWALCWAVCLLRIISWTHWETPLHIMTDRSRAGLSLTEPRTT